MNQVTENLEIDAVVEVNETRTIAETEFILKKEKDNNSTYPVFKISQEGAIIYANKAAFPLLKKWNCNASNKLPSEIRKDFPLLTNLEADENIEMSSENQKYSFSVVGFSLGGYIGLYGFHAESLPDQPYSN